MLVFYAATRGKRYEIKVQKSEIYEDTYVAEFFTRGASCGTASGYNRAQMIKRIDDEIANAKQYDGINYKIETDALHPEVCSQCGAEVEGHHACTAFDGADNE